MAKEVELSLPTIFFTIKRHSESGGYFDMKRCCRLNVKFVQRTQL